MSLKQKSKRGPKKEIVRRFDRAFDLGRLNYVARAKQVKPKAMLIGLLTAGGLYAVGFAAAYTAMSANTLPLESFAKIVWMMMVPTTIAGFFTWQLSKNRMEFPIREDIREYIHELETGEGLLWRFFPLLELADEPDHVLKKALAWSQEGRAEKLDLEDYTDAVKQLATLVYDTDGRHITPEIVDKVNTNFQKQDRAA